MPDLCQNRRLPGQDRVTVLDSAKEKRALPKFALKALWLENDLAIAVDQVVAKNRSPLTHYFFWPRDDAWEQLKTELEGKTWISEVDRIELLNRATEVINYWQNGGRNRSVSDAQAQFPDVLIGGNS